MISMQLALKLKLERLPFKGHQKHDLQWVAGPGFGHPGQLKLLQTE